MAATPATTPQIMVQKPGPAMRSRARNRVNMRRMTMVMAPVNGQLPLRRTFGAQIRSTLSNQVFEDQSEGIICYQDENGEIICEGLDEGPRICRNISRTEHDRRDFKIIDLLQQYWIQIVNSGDVYRADIGVTLQEDLKGNGSNRLR